MPNPHQRATLTGFSVLARAALVLSFIFAIFGFFFRRKDTRLFRKPGNKNTSKRGWRGERFQHSASMPERKPLPVSRELVCMIRESSRLEGEGLTLGDHLRAVDARQAKGVEFYLRACALRLDQSL